MWPIKGTTARVLADAFVVAWICRFGVPAVVTTDRGGQFVSGVWACLCRTLGIKHIMTTAYHSQANGMVEWLQRQLKDLLRARGSGAAWAEHLPWVMLGLRAAPKDKAGVLAAEMTIGAQLQLPGPVLPSQEVRELPAAIPSTCRTYAEAAAEPPQGLRGAVWVFIKRDNLTGRPVGSRFYGPV